MEPSPDHPIPVRTSIHADQLDGQPVKFTLRLDDVPFEHVGKLDVAVRTDGKKPTGELNIWLTCDLGVVWNPSRGYYGPGWQTEGQCTTAVRALNQEEVNRLRKEGDTWVLDET